MLYSDKSHFFLTLRFPVFFKKHRSRIIALCAWVILIAAVGIFMKTQDYSPRDLMKFFYHTIKDTSYGPVLFTLLYIIRPIFLFPAWTLYTLAGAVYGFWGGFAYTLVGAGISSMVAYGIGRYFAKDMPLDGKHKFVETWKHKIEENGFTTVLIMRLLYIPFDVVNFGAAFLNVGWKPFLAATLLSMIVDTGAFISFGSTIKNIDSFELSQLQVDHGHLFISFLLLLFSFMVAYVVHRYHHPKKSSP